MTDSRFSQRLDPEDIRRIRLEYRIVDVLQRLGVEAPLRSGDFMISCPRPSHPDSTPSCVVHPSTDRFYCFGCGFQGDVFTLVSELTGVRSLAQIAQLLDAGRSISHFASGAMGWSGAVVPVRRNSEFPDLDRTPLSRVLEVNAEAWQFLTRPHLASLGRGFLARRGIDVTRLESEVGEPLVGYTSADRGALAMHLQQCGFKPDEIVDSGWAVRRDGSLHERFYRRILVPVRDANSHVVGVVGRDITDRARQKYLNTATTVAFTKGSLHYRPNPKAVAPNASIVVCEGPLDALAIATSAARSAYDGLIVPVALSGTAMTSEQAHFILALSPSQPILCPDGDAAGIAAAEKWQAALLSAGRGARYLDLPDGHDPASWLQEHGSLGLAVFAAILPVSSVENSHHRSIPDGRPKRLSEALQIRL